MPFSRFAENDTPLYIIIIFRAKCNNFLLFFHNFCLFGLLFPVLLTDFSRFLPVFCIFLNFMMVELDKKRTHQIPFPSPPLPLEERGCKEAASIEPFL